jgi:hypothetical protein
LPCKAKATVENRIYDTSNPTELADLFNYPTVFSYHDTAENNNYFHVFDDIYVEKSSLVEAILINDS